MNRSKKPDKKNRVLFVDHVGVLGGAEFSLLDIVASKQILSEVTIFSDGPLRLEVQALGVQCRIIESPARFLKVSRGGGLLSAALALPVMGALAYRLAQHARDADIIYANSQKSFFVAAVTGLLVSKPVVWHLRDILSEGHFSRVRRIAATFWANRFATRVIVNSQATGDAFVAAGGRRDLVRVVYNGISLARVAPKRSREALRSELKISADTFLIGSFGRISPWKGQHILIEALASIPGVHAVIVGAALFGEEKYELELRALCERLGLTKRVHLLGFRADIADLMQTSDLIVHSGVEPEPFGRVIVEGMLAERPVICSDSGGPREIVEQGVTGILVEPGNSVALSTAILGVIQDVDSSRRLAANGKLSALKRFSVEAMREGVTRVLGELQGAHQE